jgi:hypothetical protein
MSLHPGNFTARFFRSTGKIIIAISPVRYFINIAGTYIANTVLNFIWRGSKTRVGEVGRCRREGLICGGCRPEVL